jgi:hypothetical protein
MRWAGIRDNSEARLCLTLTLVSTTGLKTYCVYNVIRIKEDLRSVVPPLSMTFTRMLIGEDSADHFAIRTAPSPSLEFCANQ